jgi:hypothetical protein
MSALARLAPESVGYGGGDREPARGRNKAAYGGLHFGLGANAQIRSGVVAADPQSPLRIAPFRRRRNHMSCCPHSKVRQHCPLRTRLEPRARTLPRERDQTVISDRSLNTFVPSRSPGAGFGTEISARTRTLVSHAAHPTHSHARRASSVVTFPWPLTATGLGSPRSRYALRTLWSWPPTEVAKLERPADVKRHMNRVEHDLSDEQWIGGLLAWMMALCMPSVA